MKTWMSSNFGQIPPPNPELAALVRLKKDVSCCEYSSAYMFDQMFFIFAGNKNNHKVSDEIRPNSTMDCRVRCP